MSNEPMESLDPELDALLESERNAKPLAEALGRVWSRVAVDLSPGAGGEVRRGRRSALRSGWLASRAATMAAVAAIAFVAGGAAGAAAYATFVRHPPERAIQVERPPARAAVVSASPALPRKEIDAPQPTAPVATQPLPRSPSVPTASPSPRAAPSTPTSTSLSLERALIDSARGELSSGNASQALALLEDHVHRFPKPQLAEEREALVIQSLVALGRYEEARAAAARFRAASPESLFLPAIDATIGSIP